MPVTLGKNVRVSVTVGDEDVVFVFPPYDRMQGAIKTLITSRIRGRGARQRLDVIAPRVRFVDQNLEGIENVEYQDEKGESKPLSSKVKGWLDKIPVSWKSTAASFFEEGEALSEEEGED